VKSSEGLSNRVTIIIRYVYIGHMKFAACMAGSFIRLFSFFLGGGSILYNCTYGCTFCMLLFNFV
jgi:hypothetical protein